MKKDIHPAYQACQVSCTCGATFQTGGTVPELKIEICSACHPFYTGQQKFIDTAGRLEKFHRRQAKASGGATFAPAANDDAVADEKAAA